MYFVTFLLKNLLRRKARSVLTAGGVAVAVGAMVALLGITDSFERSVGRAFERRGVDLVVTAAGVILPLHQLQRLMAREGRITGFSVVLERQGAAEVQRVREEIESLRDGRGRPLRLSAQPTAEYLRTAPHLRTAHAMAWLTSAVAV